MWIIQNSVVHGITPLLLFGTSWFLSFPCWSNQCLISPLHVFLEGYNILKYSCVWDWSAKRYEGMEVLSMDSWVLCTLCSVFLHRLGQVHSINHFGITPFLEFPFQEPHTHGTGPWSELTWSISFSACTSHDHSLSISCPHHRSSTALRPKTSRARCLCSS